MYIYVYYTYTYMHYMYIYINNYICIILIYIYNTFTAARRRGTPRRTLKTTARAPKTLKLRRSKTARTSRRGKT